jgi:hypothetical protein
MVRNAQDQRASVRHWSSPHPMRAGGASSHRVNAGGSLRQYLDEALPKGVPLNLGAKRGVAIREFSLSSGAIMPSPGRSVIE